MKAYAVVKKGNKKFETFHKTIEVYKKKKDAIAARYDNEIVTPINITNRKEVKKCS